MTKASKCYLYKRFVDLAVAYPNATSGCCPELAFLHLTHCSSRGREMRAALCVGLYQGRRRQKRGARHRVNSECTK